MNKTITYLKMAGVLFILILCGCQSIEKNKMVLEDGGTGFYKAVILEDKTLPGFTIYRPENMGVFGSKQKLPIVLWGNGDCQKTSGGYEKFLNEIASYGYIVINACPYSSLLQPFEGGLTDDSGGAIRMLDALDWVMAENSREWSRYYGKIDITKVAAGGQSCAGMQVIEASVDPRVTTSLICNSGMMNAGVLGGNSGISLTMEMYKKLHAPILYISGDASDAAYANASEELHFIDNVPVVMMLNQNTEYYETYEQPHGGSFAAAVIAWLDWLLKGDKSIFDSLDCHCPYSIWKIEYRNFE
ncbi:MAG: hypothetical protein JW787_04835 [Sedimentisphaerales bacterium]|nr:hypothetical protein [Sedimentisphaerales bacterium]